MVPNLFILGAPKCGTTTLYDWLGQNGAIAAPLTKEPHYYYTPYGAPISETTYKAIYQGVKGSFRYYLDASVWYLFSETAAKRIIHDIPEAKFIVCLRNPVDMAPSLHFQKIFTGHEAVEDFALAWKLNDTRAEGEFTGIVGLTAEADPRHMAYREACLLGRQIETLLSQVPRDSIFFCFLEDMSGEPRALYEELCEFLDIHPRKIEFSVKNRSKKSRAVWLRTALEGLKAVKVALGIRRETGAFAWLHRFNRAEVLYQDPDEMLRVELVKSFSQDIKLIEEITGRDLSHWTRHGMQCGDL